MSEVGDVLTEMDAFANWGGDPVVHRDAFRRWLEVLRPALNKAARSEWALVEVDRLREVVRVMEARERDQSNAPRPPPGISTAWSAPGTTIDPTGNVEEFSLKSGLSQRLLGDLGVTIILQADHEGTGSIRIDYSKAPHERRLQALLSVMGAVGDRIAFAIGNESYANILRGILARREREG